METADRLGAIEEIQQLQARYCRLIDAKQWDEFPEVFTRDVVMGLGDRATHGRDAAAGRIQASAATTKNVHDCHMPEIEVHDESHASGVWAMYDFYLERPTDGSEPCGFVGYGHYVQTYRVEDGRWRIASSHIERLFDIEPLGAGLPPVMR